MQVVTAYEVQITAEAALLFGTAAACRAKAEGAYFTGRTDAGRLDRMANKALDSAARVLGIHADDVMAVYNLHRGLPVAIGKHLVRLAK